MGGEADIGIRVFLDDAASKALMAINTQLGQIGQLTQRASSGFNQVTNSMMGLSVVAGFGLAFIGFGLALKASVDAASQFQQAMFSVAVATHVPLDVAMQYTGVLMQLGATSIYSSQQIAEGIVYLGRAGYSIHDIFTQVAQAGTSMVDASGRVVPVMASMADAGVALGIATRTSAVEGFQLLQVAMSLYQLPADKALQTANILQFAFEHQTGSVSNLISAFAALGPAAATSNAPLNEMAAALDVVGPVMGSTSKAGTALRYMLATISQPTAAASAELEKLGIITVNTTSPAMKTFADQLIASGGATQAFVDKNDQTVAGLKAMFAAAQSVGLIPLKANFDQWAQANGLMSNQFFTSSGNIKDFAQNVELLQSKLKTLTPEEQLAAEHSLFSVRGGQGAAILFAQIDKFKQYLAQLSSSQDNNGGVMQRWAQVMSTVSGAASGLRTSLTDLGVAVGLPLLPMVAQALTALNGFVSMLRNIAIANQAAGPTFLIVGLAMSAIGLVAGVVILALNGIGIAFLVMVGIILGVFAATVAVSAGITALIGWFSSLHLRASEVGNALKSVGAAVLVVGAAFAGLQLAQVVTNFIRMIPLLIQLAGEYIMLAVDIGIAAAAQARDMAVNLAFELFMYAAMLPAIIATTIAWLANAAAMIIATAPFVLIGAAIALAIVGFVLLIQHLGGLNMLLNVGKAIWASLVSVFNQAATSIRGALAQSIQQLMPVWQQLVAAFNQARPVMMALGAVIGGILAVAVAIIVGVLRGLINVLGAVIVMAIHVVAGLIQAFAGVVQFFMGFFTVLHGLFTGNLSEITGGFRTMGSGILNIVTGLWNAVKAVFVGAFNIIVGFVSGFVQGVVGFFHMLSSVLVGHSIVPEMMAAILNVFTSVFAAIRGAVLAAINAIIAIFHTLYAMAVAVITLMFSVVRALFTGGIGAAVAVLTSGVASIISRFASMPGPIGSFIRGVIAVVQGLVSAVSGAAGNIAGIVGRIAGAFQGMAGAIAGAINGAIGWVHNLMGAISSIHMPSFGGFSLPHFASGGIVSQPTLAMIGEGSEPEIVLPWSKYQAALQGAANISGSQGGGQGGVTVNNFIVDGRVVATAVFNNLTGQMQLNGLGRMMR